MQYKHRVINRQVEVSTNDGATWEPDPQFALLSGPHTADEAADLNPLNIETWFAQPVFIAGEDGVYLAQYVAQP